LTSAIDRQASAARDRRAPARGASASQTRSGAQLRVIGQATCDPIQSQAARKGSPYVFPVDWGEGHFIGGATCLSTKPCVSLPIGSLWPDGFGNVTGVSFVVMDENSNVVANVTQQLSSLGVSSQDLPPIVAL
jgi:hypothetical protein